MNIPEAQTNALGMGGHQSSRMVKDEWLTPPEIIHSLGEFDIDPCASVDRPWDTAKEHLTIHDNGLNHEWMGRVWLNPPYGRNTEHWMRRMVWHGNGIALIFARTETKIFFPWVWDHASAILFLDGRLHFYNSRGVRAKTNSGAPSVLVAYGDKNAHSLSDSGIPGKFIPL